ncbi:zinc-binding protein A33-like [Alosa alosa]|uniref:zinc-binding protein A33-like n=1 Tax=Alosa alosa TaxID=278164 RepID=UPI0020153001|nr:zinc-binding protein A33-like [Alosa alosa]
MLQEQVAFFSFTLQCPACRNIFTDPVDLPCSHTFCQKCLLDLLQPSSGQQPCPECSQPFSLKDLKPNSLLKNLVDVGREDLTKMVAAKDPQRGRAVDPVQFQRNSTLVCADHDEKLKLFCETDQKLICVICRDCAAHEGHSFKPAKEVANAYLEEVNSPQCRSELHSWVTLTSADTPHPPPTPPVRMSGGQDHSSHTHNNEYILHSVGECVL